eukprot:CAMPEP_0183484308 /NCGR_PEP_ID=MMETSP0370-20130417/178856_1 /TAXON_ID=268820 /ORGANISM="Peridinium aciculiferum, Strain PAER-2" /LENGTH=269 /DNA_ID=CAMNT_0025677599 /DNA_START=912 /DNA_END=1720 /DNA_ORIENTATION=-
MTLGNFDLSENHVVLLKTTSSQCQTTQPCSEQGRPQSIFPGSSAHEIEKDRSAQQTRFERVGAACGHSERKLLHTSDIEVEEICENTHCEKQEEGGHTAEDAKPQTQRSCQLDHNGQPGPHERPRQKREELLNHVRKLLHTSDIEVEEICENTHCEKQEEGGDTAEDAQPETQRSCQLDHNGHPGPHERPRQKREELLNHVRSKRIGVLQLLETVVDDHQADGDTKDQRADIGGEGGFRATVVIKQLKRAAAIFEFWSETRSRVTRPTD